MLKKSHHVVPALEGGWNVRKGGSIRASKHFDTKEEAEVWARKISIHQKSELFIHKRDGTIQQKVSYGQDPRPPEDSR